MGERTQEVPFLQDRYGNERRRLDEYRAQDGMNNEEQEGIEEITGGETGADQVVYSFPDDTNEFILNEVHFHNNSGADGTFQLVEVELDSGGNITSSTIRSVPINVADGATRIHSYSGEPFTADGVGINSSISGWIGIAGLSDHYEWDEPDSQNY